MARGKRSREADPVVWGCLLARLPFLYQPEVYRKELPGFVGAGDKSTSVVRGRDGGRHEYHQGRRHTGGGGGGGDRIAARRLCIVTGGWLEVREEDWGGDAAQRASEHGGEFERMEMS